MSASAKKSRSAAATVDDPAKVDNSSPSAIASLWGALAIVSTPTGEDDIVVDVRPALNHSSTGFVLPFTWEGSKIFELKCAAPALDDVEQGAGGIPVLMGAANTPTSLLALCNGRKPGIFDKGGMQYFSDSASLVSACRAHTRGGADAPKVTLVKMHLGCLLFIVAESNDNFQVVEGSMDPEYVSVCLAQKVEILRTLGSLPEGGLGAMAGGAAAAAAAPAASAGAVPNAAIPLTELDRGGLQAALMAAAAERAKPTRSSSRASVRLSRSSSLGANSGRKDGGPCVGTVGTRKKRNVEDITGTPPKPDDGSSLGSPTVESAMDIDTSAMASSAAAAGPDCATAPCAMASTAAAADPDYAAALHSEHMAADSLAATDRGSAPADPDCISTLHALGVSGDVVAACGKMSLGTVAALNDADMFAICNGNLTDAIVLKSLKATGAHSQSAAAAAAPAPAAAVAAAPAAAAAAAAPPDTPPPPVVLYNDPVIDPTAVPPPSRQVLAIVTGRICQDTSSHRVFTTVVKKSTLSCGECQVMINRAIRAIAVKYYPTFDPESFFANRVSCENPKQGVVFVISWPFSYVGISAFALLNAKDPESLAGAIIGCGIEGSTAAQCPPFGLPMKARWSQMSLHQQAEYIAARNSKRAASRKAAAPADGSW